MANLIEDGADFIDGIYQIETTDPVLGGPPDLAQGLGIANVPNQQLANRTRFLLNRTSPSSLLTALLTVDGQNSGLDADKLDGKHAGAFLTPDNFAGSNQDRADNGYQKLPGGIIFQWGKARSDEFTNFPITFPNACFIVMPVDDGTTTHVVSAGSSWNRTGFTARSRTTEGVDGVVTNIVFFAIGF